MRILIKDKMRGKAQIRIKEVKKMKERFKDIGKR